jgi:hypothetical protein
MELWGISLTTDQQEALDNTAESIFVYVDNVFIIKNIYDEIDSDNQIGIASPYLNFRDALFHFKKMYEAARDGNNSMFLQQLACIEEHLNRGIRDFAINLCLNCYIPVINEMMKSRARCVNDDIFQRLRHIYHELKNIVVEIRFGGQKLLRFEDPEISWFESMISVISEFKDLLNENIQLNNLYETTSIEIPSNPVKS